MRSNRWIVAVVGAALIGTGGLAHAEAVGSEDTLRAELQALRARITELESSQNESWLTERRAQEVKNLIHEVLSDADTRASLLADGLAAGHDGKKFFLASGDGSFKLKIVGQIQIRYIYNNRDASSDDNEYGFQLRRAKLKFKGHVGSPKIVYGFGLTAKRSSGSVSLDHAYAGYQVMDGVTLFGGQGKAPFLREELTSSSGQLAMERSLVSENFTTGRIQGVWAEIEIDDSTKAVVSVNDGANSGEAGGTLDFYQDGADIAFTARLDLKLAGEWSQMDDFSAWSDEEQAVFVGGAIHYEIAETGGGAVTPDEFLSWTIDGSIECENANFFAAIIGVHSNHVDGAADTDQYGFVIQGGVMIIPDTLEPFARWELIDPDASHKVNLITFGFNYYLNQHNAKFTTDIVWALNSLDTVATSSGLGLLSDAAAQKNQTALRAQFQLLF